MLFFIPPVGNFLNLFNKTTSDIWSKEFILLNLEIVLFICIAIVLINYIYKKASIINFGIRNSHSNFKNFNKSKHNLLQCLIFVNDMYLLSNPKSQNIFTEDVANKLDEHNIYYGRDLPIIGSSGVVHNFDFFISAKKNQKEKFINAISNPNNSMIIKSKITDAMQAKKIKRHRQNEFIFILNDSKKEINEHNKNLLHENYISTIDYSELDEKIGLLI